MSQGVTALTACRSYPVQLNVDHLDTDAGTLYFPGPIQKGNEMPDATLELGRYGGDSTRIHRCYLRDCWKDTEAMFPARSSDRLSDKSITRNIVKLVGEAANDESRLVGGLA